jgi:hypothetical protein
MQEETSCRLRYSLAVLLPRPGSVISAETVRRSSIPRGGQVQEKLRSGTGNAELSRSGGG